jgi:hypothetical protein
MVALMAISLIPLIAGRPSRAVSETTAAHTSWLRAQITASLSGDAQAAVNAALDAAAEDAAPTLEAFTQAFADAYAEEGAPVSLETLFAVPGVDRAALYEVLSSRTQQLSRTAVLPRLSLSTAPVAAASGRSPAVTTQALPPHLPAVLQATVVAEEAGRLLPCLIRTLFSARPMAP